ncbi:MAG: endonuclease/exonuclease/phosphatase family protein [Calditrichaeota bacterium]|nr:endonuclease/exonuclease/phosphatase family protein [Calditrichota bacterium]
MKLFFRIVAIAISIILSLVILFYFWAGSSQYSESDYSQIVDYKKPVITSTDTLTLISYNIGYLSAMYNNRATQIPESAFTENLSNAIDSLSAYQPDIIAFQEIDFHSNRSYYVNQMDEIAKALNFPNGAMAVNWDKRYLPFPYWPPSVHYGEMLSGQAVLSRFKLINNERFILKSVEDRPFWYRHFYLDRLLQISKLKVNAKDILIANVHLEAFQLNTRVAQARQIVEKLKPYRDQALILIGDFNAISQKQLHSGEYPKEIVDSYRDDDTIDYIKSELSFSEAVPDSVTDLAIQFSFSSEKPHLHIDHIFFDERQFERIDWRIIHATASDHFPLYLKLLLR